MYKIGDKLTIAVYPEICCAECGGVIHNHLDCPICKKEYAESDQYANMQLFEEKQIQCECGAIFKKIDGLWYDDPTVEILELPNNHKNRKYD